MTKHSQDRELASFLCLVFNKIGCTLLCSSPHKTIVLYYCFHSSTFPPRSVIKNCIFSSPLLGGASEKARTSVDKRKSTE